MTEERMRQLREEGARRMVRRLPATPAGVELPAFESYSSKDLYAYACAVMAAADELRRAGQ